MLPGGSRRSHTKRAQSGLQLLRPASSETALCAIYGRRPGRWNLFSLQGLPQSSSRWIPYTHDAIHTTDDIPALRHWPVTAGVLPLAGGKSVGRTLQRRCINHKTKSRGTDRKTVGNDIGRRNKPRRPTGDMIRFYRALRMRCLYPTTPCPSAKTLSRSTSRRTCHLSPRDRALAAD